jgi:hypothetical protein
MLTLRSDAPGKWHFSCRLPPMLDAGWHNVRLRIQDGEFSDSRRIAVGIPVEGAAAIVAAWDGLTWRKNERLRDESGEGCLTLWISGLGDNCDRNNVRVCLDHHRLPIDYISQPKEGVPANRRAGAQMCWRRTFPSRSRVWFFAIGAGVHPCHGRTSPPNYRLRSKRPALTEGNANQTPFPVLCKSTIICATNNAPSYSSRK